jgi:hypothetical protein
MIIQRLKTMGLAAALGTALLLAPPASAQRRDAQQSAEFSARTAVQTIYHNLRAAGFEWSYIKYEKMPEILVRAVDAIKRETSAYDRGLILGTFVPTYIRTFYDEIEKIDRQHQVRCIDVRFIEITLVPFTNALVRELSGRFTVVEVVQAVLTADYSFTVCEDRAVCTRQLSESFRSELSAAAGQLSFTNVCRTGAGM